jgi:hypothetical protein
MSDKLEAATRSLDSALETLRRQQERIRELERRNAQLALAVALYQYRRPRGRPKAKKVEPDHRKTGRPSTWSPGFDKKMYEAVIAEQDQAGGTTRRAIEAVIRQLVPNPSDRRMRTVLNAVEKRISRYKKSQTTD